MKSQNSCIVLFNNCLEAIRAIRKLASADYDLHTVAIVCRSLPDRKKKRTFTQQNIGEMTDRYLQLNPLQADVAGALPHFKLLHFSDMGSLEVSAFLAGALEEAFSDIGIPANSQRNYAKALASGQALLIVHDSVNKVETAADLLVTGAEVDVAVYHLEIVNCDDFIKYKIASQFIENHNKNEVG